MAIKNGTIWEEAPKRGPNQSKQNAGGKTGKPKGDWESAGPGNAGWLRGSEGLKKDQRKNAGTGREDELARGRSVQWGYWMVLKQSELQG